MDEHIISLIADHLEKDDLARFSLVNKTTYQYFTRTDTHRKMCPVKDHTTYRSQLTLLENAKLAHCMNIIPCIAELSNHRIPLHTYSITINLTKPCGSYINVVLGCDIIINTIVYCFDSMLVIKDMHKALITEKNKIIFMNQNLERLSHKLQSIISHAYGKVRIKIRDNVRSEYEKTVVDKYYKDVEKYFLRLL